MIDVQPYSGIRAIKLYWLSGRFVYGWTKCRKLCGFFIFYFFFHDKKTQIRLSNSIRQLLL